MNRRRRSSRDGWLQRELALMMVLIVLAVVVVVVVEAFIVSPTLTASSRNSNNRYIFNNKNEQRARSRQDPRHHRPCGCLYYANVTKSSIEATTAAAPTTTPTTRTQHHLDPAKRQRPQQEEESVVVFQKVVRPPSGLPDILFLGHLVEYLQEHFELPERLPMVYTTTSSSSSTIKTNDDDDENDACTDNNNEDRTLVCWDSPLSPCSDATCLRVEVVGIFTDSSDPASTTSSKKTTTSRKSQEQQQEQQKQTVPPLAMVVVRKKKIDKQAAKHVLPPLLQGLFADSEKRILTCLDRGLDDFSAGRLQLFWDDEAANKNNNKQQSLQQAQESMLEEMMEMEMILPPDDDNDDDDNEDDDERPSWTTVSAASSTSASSFGKTNTAVMDADIVTVEQQQQQSYALRSSDEGVMHPSLQKAVITNAAAGSSSTSANAKKQNYSPQQEAALRTMTTKATTTASSSSQRHVVDVPPLPLPLPPVGLDFAVQAARQAAAARRDRSSSSHSVRNDFAVQAAAAQVAAVKASSSSSSRQQEPTMNRTTTTTTTATTTRSSSSTASSSSRGRPKKATAAAKPNQNIVHDPMVVEEQPFLQKDLGWSMSRRPPMLDPQNSAPRAFVTTISKAEDYRRQKPKKKETREKSTKKKEPLLSKTSPPQQQIDGDNVIESQQQQQPATTTAGTTRRLNLVVQQKKQPSKNDGRASSSSLLDNSRNDDAIDSSERALQQKDDDDEEEEILQATKEALDDLAASGSDISAEELLQRVLQFGDDQEKETQVGQGFVSGALEKAKDLLREQKRKRDQAQAQFLPQPVETVLEQNRRQRVAPDPQTEEEAKVRSGVKTEVLSPDEEIRRMFEAGERIADGRISVATASSGSLTTPAADNVADELQVDSLIAAEKTISGHARVLDDELAELELRINRSPDEHTDGPTQRKSRSVFDIFSGPEVYNPNVDAETAVNWPGALPGTRDVKQLPGALREAIKQAQFAVEILTNLEERQTRLPNGGESTQFFCGGHELTREQVKNLQLVANEAVETGLIDDPLLIVAERSRLQMLLDELWHQPEERVREISSNYKDLLLSDNFVSLVKERLSKMADRDIEALRNSDESLEESHFRERELLGILVGYAQLLLKEARALGAELEAQQLEVIRSICKVAMNPRHLTEEETSTALTDAVRGMRPLFDDAFVAYLKYAVVEEEGRLARAGLLDDPEHNKWLFVLKIVQQGVYKELERGISRYIDHIWYVLRMETPVERRLLLQKLIDVMPTMDVRPFVHVVENIVGTLGDAVSGDFDAAATLGEMTNALLQLRRDVSDLLPPERIALMSRDADEWAARQKSRLLEQRKQTQQRLEAARQTEHLDEEIEALGRRGEMERIE